VGELSERAQAPLDAGALDAVALDEVALALG
jgi:hypothetical protein